MRRTRRSPAPPLGSTVVAPILATARTLASTVVAPALASTVVALLLCAAPARAEGPTVALAREGLDDATAARLAAELVTAGFAIVEPSDVAGRPAPGPNAIVRAARDAAGIEVCVRRAPPSRKARCEIARADPGSAGNDDTLAIRAVELLRAALLDVRRTRQRRPPVPEEPPPPARPSPRFGVALAPALLVPVGLSPAPGLLVAARWMPARSAGISALAFVPMLPSRISAPEGAATVRAVLLGGGLRLATRLADSAWVPSLELGAAGAWLHTAGDAVSPYVSRTSNQIVAIPYLRAGLGVDLASHLGLRADLLGGAALPRPDIVFAGRPVASWGGPLFLASLGVDVHW